MNDTTQTSNRPVQEKKVFLVAAFHHPGPLDGGPATGMAEDVFAVIGMAGEWKRFAWVGADQDDSIGNPALVTPVKVRLALPSPWHRKLDNIVTGLVQLAPDQLGSGSVDEDVDHLLAELATSRGPQPVSSDQRPTPDRAPATATVTDQEIISR